jgi:epsin
MSFFSSVVSSVRGVVGGADPVRAKLLDATSQQKWGPTVTQMQELADMTFSYEQYPLLMTALWEQMANDGKHWRHVYKSLVVLEYLVRCGSHDVVVDVRTKLSLVQGLRDFSCEEEGKDVGLGVRQKAKWICEIVNDEKNLTEEREKVCFL